MIKTRWQTFASDKSGRHCQAESWTREMV